MLALLVLRKTIDTLGARVFGRSSADEAALSGLLKGHMFNFANLV